MKSIIEQKVHEWNDSKTRETNLKLHHLEKRIYSTYEPSQPPKIGFWKRLEKWIDNVSLSEVEQKLLFNSITDLFYIGPKEFEELYRIAYHSQIGRWLIDEMELKIDGDDIAEVLLQATKETWFCPISDSMRINSFYHVNQIPASHDYRPDWRSMFKFADEQKIRDYCTKNKIKRIILLEDFVGGGSQMADAVQFAANLSDIVSILVVPLVICPKGLEKIKEIEGDCDVTFSPVLSLNENCFISKNVAVDEKTSITELRQFVYDRYLLVSNGQPKAPGVKPYGPLGYYDTGGMIVMYTNTPDNTLPIIHWNSEKWEPLFPRHSRV